MEHSAWQLIVDPPGSGSTNMQIDEALLLQAEESAGAVTVVRFYQWNRPTVSLGRHQKMATAIALDACRRAGVDVVRRPTGGRAVLHHAELTYAVISNEFSHFPQDVDGTYRKISQALLEGLARLGVEAELARSPVRRAPSPGGGVPCFATASRHEILWGGRKLVGSAQRRLRRSFLQHGSLPLALDWDLMSAVFRSDATWLQSSMVDLKEVLGEPPIPRIQECLAEGFRGTFDIELRRTAVDSSIRQPASARGG